jgi:hypothetical protein
MNKFGEQESFAVFEEGRKIDSATLKTKSIDDLVLNNFRIMSGEDGGGGTVDGGTLPEIVIHGHRNFNNQPVIYVTIIGSQSQQSAYLSNYNSYYGGGYNSQLNGYDYYIPYQQNSLVTSGLIGKVELRGYEVVRDMVDKL